MDIFKPRFDNSVTRGFEQLHTIAVASENLKHQLEVTRQHIRNKYCIVLFHFLGKGYVFTLFHLPRSFRQARL